jgi:glycosyltransferase involved in cell wall biosynthesis
VRILVDALAAVRGGGAAYLQNLLPILGTAGPSSEYLVLRAPWQEFWDFALPNNIRLLEVPELSAYSVPRRLLWEQFKIPQLIRRYQVDLLYSPLDVTALWASCPVVLAIRNANAYVSSRSRRSWRYSLNRRVALRGLTWLSARKAKKVVFVSDFIRTIACQQLGVSFEKTVVVYHGLDPAFGKGPSAEASWVVELARPYLLTVSSITAHKNYPFLARMFVEAARQPGFGYHLVIAGASVYDKHVEEIQRIVAEAGLQNRVHLLGRVDRSDLPVLYRRAALFIFPSLLESFGHPLVEAMACGVPIVTSDAGSIPEICQDAALYFDPTDLLGAIEKMRQALNSTSLREQLIARGLRRAGDFSWEKTSRDMVDVFRSTVCSETASGLKKNGGYS